MGMARWVVVRYVPGHCPDHAVAFSNWEDAAEYARHSAEMLREVGYVIYGNISDRILFGIRRDSRIAIAIFDTERIQQSSQDVFFCRKEGI